LSHPQTVLKTLIVRRDVRALLASEVAPPREGEFVWIDLISPTEEELSELRQKFAFHPLSLDDVRTYDQRPKLEEFGDHLFLVVHRLESETSEAGAASTELHAFLGARFLVTAHASRCAELDTVMARVERDRELQGRGPGFWFYLVSEAIADASSTEIDELGDLLEAAEEKVLTGSAHGVLESLLELKRKLATARRLVSTQRDVYATLAKFGSDAVPERTAVYFRNVYDQLVRSLETLDSLRELATNALEAHFSILSQRTNEIMKHLTVLSSIFLPLTFVTGFFGQNFEHLPFGSDALMWAGIGSCLLLPATMLAWFRLKRWL
jgi:magnesium transporter